MSEPARREPTPPPRLKSTGWNWLLLILVLGYLFLILGGDAFGRRSISYHEFKQHLAAGELQQCLIEADRIRGELAPGAAGAQGEDLAFQTVRVEDPDLVAELQAAGVDYSGVPESSFPLWMIWVLPFALLMLFWVFLRRMGGAMGASGAAMSFGKSKARLVADLDTGVTFDDVAGCDEAKTDLREIVDFLRRPERYLKLGARIPKGLLLVGAPGTGKTLFARAIAGEASVPFYSISGSEFVEMFVGVGAARVRDLFEQALAKAPCIVFIDEIDAIGRSRGIHIGAVNDEREQTLNQLLVEMDGFEANNGVVLLAATNRPDVLDRALLRPGRFDRQVVLDVPDVNGRRAILEVHARGKPLAGDVDLEKVARATPGFAGADLANALNEAALVATRRDAEAITQDDIEAAIERLVAGPERKSHRLSEKDKRRVAFHEAGHALIARLSEHADPVHKISIVPRGRAALGYTMQLPEEEHPMLTRSELDDKLAGLLGGRAAERIVFGEVSTGAANDLEHATNLARQMICLYGMGESAGLMRCAHEADGRFPLGPETMQRDCSERTAREIDQEVRQILADASARAEAILEDNRDRLDSVATALLSRETLDAAAFEEILDLPDQSHGEERHRLSSPAVAR